MVCGDPASDGGVVGTPNYRGIPLGKGPDIYRPRQRTSFRQRIYTPHPGDGHSDRPTSFRSPWQNGHVERLIGSMRRECTDHLIVLNEEHLRQILAKFSTYYNGWRPHVSLGKDAPDRRPIERSETSSHMQYWADYITGTHESIFGSDTRSGPGLFSFGPSGQLGGPYCTRCPCLASRGTQDPQYSGGTSGQDFSPFFGRRGRGGRVFPSGPLACRLQPRADARSRDGGVRQSWWRE